VPAVIGLDFDPSTVVFGLSIRLETLAIAGTVFLVLVLVALSAGRSRPAAGPNWGAEDAPPKLRRDDLMLIAFGVVPGAVVGGRLGYALMHWDYYSANPSAIADPGQGGFGLTLAVVLGTLAGIAVARLLAAPLGRWLAVATLPMLIGLGLGKLAMVLGGSGQGSYSNASWATSYVQQGPWNSINPDFAAVPSQAIEGALVLAVALLILVVPFSLRLRLRPMWRVVGPGLAPRREWSLLVGGRRYLTGLGLWAVVRFVAAFTWRDARVLGPLVADQVVLLLVAVVAFLGPVVVHEIGSAWTGWRSRRAAGRTARALDAPTTERTP
jgi:prolipoprotein diacylglyceryltransferase